MQNTRAFGIVTESLLPILDNGKPVVRRGRKAMGSYPAEGGRIRLPGYRRDGRDPTVGLVRQALS